MYCLCRSPQHVAAQRTASCTPTDPKKPCHYLLPDFVLHQLAGDFGLARLLLGNVYILNRSGSGTIAYQAPEVCAVRETTVWV